MKLFCSTLTVFLIFMITNVFAQSAFQGKVVFSVETDGEEQVMNYLAKDNKLRMEVPDEGGYILFDTKNSKMYIVMDEQQMYMETDLQGMGENSNSSTRSITKTGQTKKILGHDCEKFTFVDEDSKGEAWMTKELGSFMFFTQNQQDVAGWQNEVLKEGYFPLQVTEYDEDGAVESNYTVVEVTPKELSADMFTLPPSYQKLDIGNMGNIKDMMK